MTPASHTLRETIRDLQPIGTALTDAAARLAYMRDLLPPRGELTEEYDELLTVFTRIENAYHDADEALLEAYTLAEHSERAEREGWTPQPLNASHNGSHT